MIPAWLAAAIGGWLTLPVGLQLAVLAVAGSVAGAIANHVIYTWCYRPRPVSPWLRANVDPPVAASRWSHRIPVAGWLLRRRHRFDDRWAIGRWFWVRPLLIESSLAVAFPLYFRWVMAGGVLPDFIAPPMVLEAALWLATLAAVHLVALSLMTAATFIDFDERTIPDVITIPGTLFFLVAASMSPAIFLPGISGLGFAGSITPVLTNHPEIINAWWLGGGTLAIGWAIWTAWCFALADRRLILRHGLAKAVRYFCAGLTRSGFWKWLLGLWLVGLMAIASVFATSGAHWIGLITSLVGLAVGGGTVWAIRIVASAAMGVEAMGFGDVTLMAMLGAAVGWQAALLAFFLSPLAAVAIVVVVWVITRDPRTPFGPYLCMGTILTVLFWNPLYNDSFRITVGLLGGNILPAGVFLLVVLGSMLAMWRAIKGRLLA